MKYMLPATLGLLCCSALCAAEEPRFHPPVRLKAGGVPIHVEAPGYAAPCLADLDGKGKMDLLVGQFNGGKISKQLTLHGLAPPFGNCWRSHSFRLTLK